MPHIEIATRIVNDLQIQALPIDGLRFAKHPETGRATVSIAKGPMVEKIETWEDYENVTGRLAATPTGCLLAISAPDLAEARANKEA